MFWTVEIPSRVRKQADALPERIRQRFLFLLREMREMGPTRANRPHYGKLKGRGEVHHCHLNAGRPRYVAVWEVVDKKIRLIEVRYVGTHEKADY